MATRYGKLPLNDSPRTSVFRCIDDILRSDPEVKRIFAKPGSFKSWQGDPGDKLEFAKTQAPALRLTPFPEAEEYWYPGQMKGSITVHIELLIDGTAIDDVDNVFYAIQRALVPSDNALRLANEKRLKAAGAMIGQIHFTQPAVVASADAGTGCCGQFRATAMLRTEVKTT